jgi:NADPH:quinone reductase-like Zn-dependent oxidoreductase
MRTTMRAAVCVRAGGPEVLEIRELPVPAVREGWSLVRVMGVGLNRSELRTRQGHSPGVRFPRVRVVRNVEAGVYRPNVDRVFGLDDVVAAHRYMEDNQAAGKVVMLPWGTSRA